MASIFKWETQALAGKVIRVRSEVVPGQQPGHRTTDPKPFLSGRGVLPVSPPRPRPGRTPGPQGQVGASPASAAG